MKINITPFNVIASVAIIILLYIVLTRKPDKTELDLYKKAYIDVMKKELDKIAADSTINYKKLEESDKAKDSIKAHYNNLALNLQKTIKYYESKVHSAQTDPITIVDSQFDSILLSIRNKYK